jgi:hypothetical protein
MLPEPGYFGTLGRKEKNEKEDELQRMLVAAIKTSKARH